MIGVYISILINILCIFNKADAGDEFMIPNILGMDDYLNGHQTREDLMNKKIREQSETVEVKIYYESMCPGCIYIEQKELKPVVQLLTPYISIKTYPYGNAETIETNGEVVFKCQHGPEECYGNKLHACSLKHIANHTQAILFNICMMESKHNSVGSDDASAARCASEMNVDKDAIIQCAKGKEGTELHKYYGEESKKANFNYVPYVLINERTWEGRNRLVDDVCAAFKNPPAVCQN